MRFTALVLLAGVFLAACGQSSGPSAGGPPNGPGQKAKQAALTVTVTNPESLDAAQTLDTSGGLYAWQEVAIGAEVSGYRVSEVLVDVGDRVSKGAVLAKLDDTLLRESYNQAQAAATSARATLEQTQSAAQRGNTLQATGVISKQDVEQLNTAAATAAAQVANADSQLQAAKQRLDYAVIRAPDDGVIATRNIVPGQIPNTGTTLLTMIRQSRVEWRAEVPSSDIARVRAGMTATIQRADGSRAMGKVRTVSPGIDNNTQRGIAYVDLALEPQVRPGMYVTGSIQLGKAATLTVPLAAVTTRDGFSYVFVVQANGTIRQQRVTLGALTTDKVQIREGVTAADRIVAAGVGFLRDGDTVGIANAYETEPAKTAATK